MSVDFYFWGEAITKKMLAHLQIQFQHHHRRRVKKWIGYRISLAINRFTYHPYLFIYFHPGLALTSSSKESSFDRIELHYNQSIPRLHPSEP
jgi:hypothetical protein